MHFQIGDIVKDVSADYADCNMTGIIVGAAVVFGRPVFHVRFFDDENIIAFQPHEIEKVA